MAPKHLCKNEKRGRCEGAKRISDEAVFLRKGGTTIPTSSLFHSLLAKVVGSAATLLSAEVMECLLHNAAHLIVAPPGTGWRLAVDYQVTPTVILLDDTTHTAHFFRHEAPVRRAGAETEWRDRIVAGVGATTWTTPAIYTVGSAQVHAQTLLTAARCSRDPTGIVDGTVSLTERPRAAISTYFARPAAEPLALTTVAPLPPRPPARPWHDNEFFALHGFVPSDPNAEGAQRTILCQACHRMYPELPPCVFAFGNSYPSARMHVRGVQHQAAERHLGFGGTPDPVPSNVVERATHLDFNSPRISNLCRWVSSKLTLGLTDGMLLQLANRLSVPRACYNRAEVRAVEVSLVDAAVRRVRVPSSHGNRRWPSASMAARQKAFGGTLWRSRCSCLPEQFSLYRRSSPTPAAPFPRGCLLLPCAPRWTLSE